MATAATHAFGTTLKKGATAIAELTNIGGPGVKADTIDVTSHDSPDKFREFLAGVKDGGEISIEGNLKPTDAGQIALYTDICDGSSDAYTITYPDAGAATWTFNALVTAFEVTAAYEDQIGFSATLKVNGKPVFAA